MARYYFENSVKNIRFLIFLKDVAIISVTAFGGPQYHMLLFLKNFVRKRSYLTEDEFMELNALCQILPGPTSTQTIVALGYRIGGPILAYLTMIVWAFPAVLLMTSVGIIFSYIHTQGVSTEFTRFIQPMATGFVIFAAFRISSMVIHTRLGWLLAVLSALVAYLFTSPWVFPLVVICGGVVTAIKFKELPQEKDKKIKVEWGNFILFWGVLILLAILGAITRLLPILLFENFYRNGSFIYGGGQVLVPVLFTEFVDFKQYLSHDEFLSGYGLAQCIPGPVFSFTSFIGVLSMREYGFFGEFLGGLVAAFGIFLPGIFMIFFVIRFWEQLKKYRVVKASIEGINASSAGLVIAAAILITQTMIVNKVIDYPFNFSWVLTVDFAVMIVTALLLYSGKVRPPFIILSGLVFGFIRLIFL